jgi:hypothetical protein
MRVAPRFSPAPWYVAAPNDRPKVRIGRLLHTGEFTHASP